MESLNKESLDVESEEKMTWEYFDDHYHNWDNDTIYERIQYLDNLGEKEDILYAVYNFDDKRVGSVLMEWALEKGENFSVEEITDLADCVEQDTLRKLLENYLTRNKIFSVDDVFKLEGIVRQEILNTLVKKAAQSGVFYTPDDLFELSGLIDENTIEDVVTMYVKKGHNYSIEDLQNFEGIINTDTIDAIVNIMLDRGVSYSMDELNELQFLVESNTFGRAALNSNYKFTLKNLEELENLLDEEDFIKLENKVFDRMKKSKKKKSGLLEDIGMVAMLKSLSDEFIKKDKKYNLGDHIRVKYSGLEGSIIDVNGDRYMISFEDGTKVESYLESDLEDAF